MTYDMDKPATASGRVHVDVLLEVGETPRQALISFACQVLEACCRQQLAESDPAAEAELQAFLRSLS